MKKTKEEKAKEKALLKEVIDEEQKEKDNEPSSFEIIKSLFEKDPEEVEFDEYYKENFKEEYEEEQKENKRMLRIIIISSISVIAALSLCLYIFSEIYKSDLLKVTKPLIENYYHENYNGESSIDDISYLQKYNSETKKYEDTSIVLSTLTDNNHIMCVDNANIGDDINIEKIYDSYELYKKNNFSETNIIVSNPTISYSDYYLEYSIFYDYIKVLPYNISFDDMLSSKKITISDVWLYEGELNLYNIQNFLQQTNINSKIYAIKENAGLPVELTIITNNDIMTFPIDATIQLDDNITNYSFNNLYSDITLLTVNKINSKGINNENDYDYENSYNISFDKIRRGRDEVAKPTYYLIKFSNNSLTSNNLALLNGNGYGSKQFKEYDKDFPEVVYIGYSDNLYIIGNQKVGISNKVKKESFLCKLNLC